MNFLVEILFTGKMLSDKFANKYFWSAGTTIQQQSAEMALFSENLFKISIVQYDYQFGTGIWSDSP